MAPIAVTLPREVCNALGLKAEESAFREGSATIVLPSKETAFLNPVQEFNRDLSTLAIRTWGQIRNEEKKKKFIDNAEKRASVKKRKEAKAREKETKRRKLENGNAVDVGAEEEQTAPETTEGAEIAKAADTNGGASHGYRDYHFTVLEALSATGLRSIRYAREIPLLKYVLANDLSSSAVDAMKRNVALNFPADKPLQEWKPSKYDEKQTAKEGEQNTEATKMATSASEELPSTSVNNSQPKMDIHPQCKVRINEGDAMSLMYSHRDEKKRFDVIDLDPYGSAAIFLDGAVQAVNDGGLLCVTCTDSAVLAGTGYPEKCYSAYGGVGTRVEYCHEVALRLLLHAISTSAGRYGRYMEPVLTLSIDFYIRVFVRIYTRPVEVKKLASQTGAVLTCHYCQSPSEMRFGRHSIRSGGGKEGSNDLDKYQGGSGPSVGTRCEECGSSYALAGPMWLGRLHNQEFCKEMLRLANEDEVPRYKTIDRINGMVGMAIDELQDVPFYLTPSRISSFFHCNSPPLVTVVSALLHAGYQVSRSHCTPGSIKTNASRKELYDLWRNWIKLNAVNMQNINPNSPAITILSHPIVKEFIFDDEHPDARKVIEGSSGKGTRYQLNPLPNWGPGTAARSTTRSKASASTTT
jgi:tRNA (guanine26-N2/guanine27-N2)-dimethyltransferase